VRDGRSNLASLKKLYHFRGSPWQTRANVLYLAESHLRALENRERFGESIYLVVSYEQLVERTDSTMHRISEFLNIRFNESMLRPTVNGFPATANSMFKTKQTIGQVRRLDAASLGEVLSREDDDALIALFYPRIQEFGYLDGVGKAKRYSAIVRTWLRKIRSVHLTPHKS
jgi:hypothetical protein